MPINESVYGTKTQWQDVHTYDTSIPSEKRIKAAYFGGANYYDNNLRLGNTNGKTPINEPIDKSLSYCGLGNESAFSNFKYYDILDIQSASVGDTIQPFFKENRDVTNFAFTIGNSNRPGDQTFLNARNTTNGNNSRYAPTTGNIDSNTSRLSWFISYFSFDNFIALIYVHCFNGTFTDGQPANSEKVTLYNYENDVNSVKTNKPYIYAVTIQPFTRYNANNDRMAMQATADGKAIEILDSYNGGTSEAGAPFYTYGALQNDNDGEFLVHGLVTGRGTASYQSGIAIPPEHTIFQIASIPDTWSLKLTKKNSSYVNQQTVRQYDQTFYEECMKAVACFGLFFTDKLEVAQSGALNDAHMFCGTLEDGVGHGQYTHGNDNKDQFQYNKTSNDTNYDPAGGGGGDTPYDSHTSRITAGSGIAVGGRWYVDDELSTWMGLLSWCSGLDLGNYPKDEYFYGQNPIDCILEGKMIFVTDYKFGKTVQTQKTPIVLGSYSGGDGVGAYSFTLAKPETFNCGYVIIGNNNRYGDFRDYEPYTNLTLLLPFANSIELPPNLVIGHRVDLTETIDPQSGDLKYHVYIDGTEYASANGNCAIDLSINGLEIATYRQQKFNLQTQSVMATYNAAASLVGGASGALIAGNYGNIAGAASQILGGIVNASSGMYQAQRYKEESSHLKPPPARIQNSTPNVEWGDCAFPCIVMTAPYMLEGYTAASYQQLVGFATYTVDQIKNHSYWVKCEEVTLSGLSCTDTEQKAIKELLQSGIYIKPTQN